MLIGPHFTIEDSAVNANNFMVSDFGWTVYLPSFGDHDPASTNPERLFVRKGVPTDRKTGEQKLRVRDVANLANFDEMMPCRHITDRGMTYVPRCLSRVIQRTKYYGSQRNAFHLDIAFKVEELVDREDDRKAFDLHMSYCELHYGL